MAKRKKKSRKKKKRKRGRPRKFRSPKEMQKAIDEYFAKEEDPTVCGLALHLGFISRQSFFDYSGYSEKFSDTIKKAKLRIEQSYELSLRKNGRSGDIFALKNFGWTDKQQHEHSGNITLAQAINDLDDKDE